MKETAVIVKCHVTYSVCTYKYVMALEAARYMELHQNQKRAIYAFVRGSNDDACAIKARYSGIMREWLLQYYQFLHKRKLYCLHALSPIGWLRIRATYAILNKLSYHSSKLPYNKINNNEKLRMSMYNT